MKLIDRLLVIRRAVMIALHPNCSAVIMVRADKDMKMYKNAIFSDSELSKDAYIKYMQSFFLDNAKSGESLHNTALYFLHGVQDVWNKNNSDDKVYFIGEKS